MRTYKNRSRRDWCCERLARRLFPGMCLSPCCGFKPCGTDFT
jgi:hypothetical protein